MDRYLKIAEALAKHRGEVTYTFSQKERAIAWLLKTMRLLFPQVPKAKQGDLAFLEAELRQSVAVLAALLSELEVGEPEEAADKFHDELPRLKEVSLSDLEAIFMGDPAAKSKEEIVLTYPGFTAILVYRIAHYFYEQGVVGVGYQLLSRIFSEYAHQITGIDIHAGAKVGRSFCIDHGTGVVIGETAVIGERVKIYQGVTLGALSVKKELSNCKRHPTVEDDVVIYSNTTILGGETVVGKGAVIGGNVWLTESVPAGSKVYRKFELEFRSK